MNRSPALISFACLFPALASAQQFALHDGDRVVFYGDSITDNSPYTYDVEAFVTLRYPKLKVTFMNAGVGGDRISGGWMGPIDDRLTRDLFSRKPTVITSMLGMNDASYRPFDQGIFDTFVQGYHHIADRIKKEAPNARVWLFRPSPFDDVTRKPGWDPGYNTVLNTYGDSVQKLASESGFNYIDQNSPLVEMLQKAFAINPADSAKIIPDRVHPAPPGHLVMTDTILKAWNASPMVSKTTIEWTSGKATTEDAEVKHWNDGAFEFKENSLPMPLERKDPLTALVLRSSTLEADLNQETLTVTGMPAGQYSLTIDGLSAGNFSEKAFADGIDLSSLDTPMMRQAIAVFSATGQLGNLRYNRWRTEEVMMGDVKLKERDQAVDAIERLEAILTKKRAELAQPIVHKVVIALVK